MLMTDKKLQVKSPILPVKCISLSAGILDVLFIQLSPETISPLLTNIIHLHTCPWLSITVAAQWFTQNINIISHQNETN